MSVFHFRAAVTDGSRKIPGGCSDIVATNFSKESGGPGFGLPATPFVPGMSLTGANHSLYESDTRDARALVS